MDLSKYGFDEADFYEAIASFKVHQTIGKNCREVKQKWRIKILRILQAKWQLQKR
jgi:hypothetical protein